jgi:hypothetical protein
LALRATFCSCFSQLSRSAKISSVDDFDVALRVDAVGNVDHVLVFEAAHHVGDGVGFADVGQELVAQAFTFEAPATRPAMSTNSMVVGRMRFGLTISARASGAVRHRRCRCWARWCRREVLGRDAGLGQGVEQGGFADVGQADDAAIESHGVSPPD